MRARFGWLSLCGCFLLGWAPAFAQTAELREWTDAQGRKLSASYAGMQGDSVILKLANGQTVPYPMMRLSNEDQAFVRSMSGGGTAAAATNTAPAPERLPLEKRTWPPQVMVPTRSIEINPITEEPAQRKYIYRSEAFEFMSQAKLAGSVMKEVARTFEATRSLVNALPWGVVCQPPEGMERFEAALYETRADYIAAGGPENSGGVYSSGDNIFKIPFPSLGLEKRGQTYFKNDNFSNDTLVHEITHQMMDEYLVFLPVWVIEGTAEYTEMLPYKAGVFRADSHKTGVKEYIEDRGKSGLTADIGSLEKHMTMTRDTWQTESSSRTGQGMLYFRSLLLVYYFSHLDGDKKGTRFLKFMDAVHGEVAALRNFFKDPRVKRFEDGRFSYPRDFPPPDMKSESAPFKHLSILMDGRTHADIAQEIIEGYKSIGVKVTVN